MSPFTLTVTRPEFARALATVSKAVNKRNTLPILNYVLIEIVPTKNDEAELTLTATDLDTVIKVRLPALVSFSEPQSIALPSDALSDFVSKLKCDVFSFEWEQGDSGTSKILLKGGKSRYNVTSAPAEDFPATPEVIQSTDTLLASVGEGILRRAFGRTLFAASKEEHKSILMGALLNASEGKLSIVTTDTHRMAHVTCQGAQVPNTRSVIVPAKPLQSLISELRESEDMVSIYSPVAGSQVTIVTSTFEMTSRVLDGQYPNYAKVVPKSFERQVTFSPLEMADALRLIDIVSSNASHKATFGFGKPDPEQIAIRAESSESGGAIEDEVTMQMVEGSPLSIVLNVSYFIQALDNMCLNKGKAGEESVMLRFNGNLNPLQLLPAPGSAEEWYHILMPMQA